MSGKTGELRWLLVILLVIAVSLWLYVGPLAPEPKVSGAQTPRAATVTPRCFKLWELHPEDMARSVEVVTAPSAIRTQVRLYGPSLRATDAIVSFAAIGGELTQPPILSQETYRGQTYQRPEYVLRTVSDRYGYDLVAAHPPHLHDQGAQRTFSLGIDPHAEYAQEIIAVALPAAARIESLYDYKPYRQVALAGWDVFYYDVSAITRHISIHIRYRPAEDLPVLDWQAVAAQR